MSYREPATPGTRLSGPAFETKPLLCLPELKRNDSSNPFMLRTKFGRLFQDGFIFIHRSGGTVAEAVLRSRLCRWLDFFWGIVCPVQSRLLVLRCHSNLLIPVERDDVNIYVKELSLAVVFAHGGLVARVGYGVKASMKGDFPGLLTWRNIDK